MKPLNPDIARLQDVLTFTRHALEFSAEGMNDYKTICAAAYAVAVVGEAVNHLSPTLCEAHPHIPWIKIIGMRHRIIHGYGNFNVERLKEVVAQELPILAVQIEAILAQLTA